VNKKRLPLRKEDAISFNMENQNNSSETEAPGLAQLKNVTNDITLQTGDINAIAGMSTYGNPTAFIPSAISRPAGDDLALFFKRPVLLDTINWTSGLVQSAIYPYTRWFGTPTVHDKLANYSLVRLDLHVVFIFSAQPMLYGGLRVCYNPWGISNQAGIERGGDLRQCTSDLTAYLSASSSAGAHFILPFFYDTPWLSNARGTNEETNYYNDIGGFITIPVAPLARADAVAPGNLTVRVYGWAENVQLAAPTFISQSGEYASGPVSRPATALAKVAGMFSGVPIVGKFARATEIGATALASVATLFGFSKPVNITDSQVVVQRAFSRFAFTSGVDTAEKLSTDPKQELTVDPQSVGLPPEEMSTILSMASREAYLTAFNLTTADTPYKYLTSWCVSPKAFNQASLPNIFPSHVMWASLPFGMWTGSLIYRFRIFSSPFIRGRLLVAFDPAYGGLDSPVALPDMSTTSPPDILRSCKYCMLDLASDTDVEFRVGWAQAQRWARAYLPAGIQYDPAGETNGRVGVWVDAPITAPGACTVTVLVTIRAGEDFMVADPAISAMNEFQMQSGEALVVSNATGNGAALRCDLYSGSVDPVAAASCNVGERIVSMRAMAKRYCALTTLTAPSVSTANTGLNIMTYAFSPWPEPRRVSVGTNGGNLWTWASWWAVTHAGHRGGMRIKISHNIPSTVRATICIARLPANNNNTLSTNGLGYRYPRRLTAANVNSVGSTAFLYVDTSIGDGAMVIDAHAPGGIEVDIPWHWYRDMIRTVIPTGDIPTFEMPFIRLSVETFGAELNNVYFNIYSAAAEDYTPFYYVAPPPAIAINTITPYSTWA